MAWSRPRATRLARHNDLVIVFVHDPLEAALPHGDQLLFSDGDSHVEAATIFDNKTGEERILADPARTHQGQDVAAAHPGDDREAVRTGRKRRGGVEGDARSLDFTRLRYDRPDILNLSMFWRLPGDFDLTVINRYQSGALYSPTVYAPGLGIVIDPNQGKNSRRQTPLRSLDLSLSKSFGMGRGQLRVTGQVFNLLNNLNVTTVDTFGSSAGRPVDVDFGRMFQVGVEVRF